MSEVLKSLVREYANDVLEDECGVGHTSQSERIMEEILYVAGARPEHPHTAALKRLVKAHDDYETNGEPRYWEALKDAAKDAREVIKTYDAKLERQKKQ